MTVTDIFLETSKVFLRPVQPVDYGSFWALTSLDKDMWEYFSLNLSLPVQLEKWIAEAVQGKNAGTRLPFTIIVKATGSVAGSSSIGNIAWYDKRAEIGWSWLAPTFRGTGINFHAKFCLLYYAFEVMNMERVEFKTGVQNLRARRGLEKVGGVAEGVLRSHSLLWNGNRRTSIYYSVLKDEWEGYKKTIFADLMDSFKWSSAASNNE
ncbi:GNAT family N-acetyltransferase [Niabella soli]|uniref:Acetyltransferase GCN5 n=1 Tax=Niabella soli DSM 19437 TaxID=929713 RepID=W0F5V3_9BACT|nr:GNAT family protein [Niabella soli]AHF16711.1 acetyltransferase GCN5 [Niabella soli DSM 19437]